MKQPLVLLILFPFLFPAQGKITDSLKSVLKTTKQDSTRCSALLALGENLYVAKPDSAFMLWDQAQKIAESNLKNLSELLPAQKKVFLKHLASALNNMGYLLQQKGDIKKAIEYFGRGLKLDEEVGYKQGIATTLNNLGIIYSNQGDIAKALEYYGKSLKIRENIRMPNGQLGDKAGIANSLNNLGFIYEKQRDTAKALEFYNKSLKMLEELGDKHGVASALNNIGFLYDKKRDIATALEYYHKSLKIREESGDKQGVANSLDNIGFVYLKLALTSRNETDKQKNLSKALVFELRSLKLSREIGYPEIIRNAARQLKFIYKAQKKYGQALEMYELFISMRDSIGNEETKKAGIKNQLKYEYEKKSAADSVKNAEQQKVKDAQLAAQTASLKQERFERYSLVVGLALVVLGLLFVINRFRITNKQKKIIEEQKIVVDQAFEKLREKNKEVMDSIYYARKIQRALITSEHYINKQLKALKQNA
ncbi:MAG: tetratricopeptide repeat protein [Bacteroidia bacterium]|nr:tetratricopeptide repeat protein [Bacteroidia bacterium]